MSPNHRRAAARRKAWGRGPMILRFEPLEGRALLSGGTTGAAASTDATATTIVSTTGATTDPGATAGASGTTQGSGGSQASGGDGTVVITASTTSSAAAAGTTTTGNATGPETATSGTTTTGGAAVTGGTTTGGTGTTTTSTPTTPQPGKPDLAIGEFGTLHNLAWGQAFRAQGTVRNLGTAAAPAGVKVDVYASPVNQLGPSSVYVGTGVIAEAIEPGGSATFDVPMLAPPLPIGGLGSSPSYYMIARADGDGTVAESSEANNGGEPNGPTSLVTITPLLKAKLEATALRVTPGSLSWGDTIDLNAQITNTVPGSVAPPTRARIVLYPRGQSATGPAAVTIGELTVPQLTAYPPADLYASIKLPDAPAAVQAGTSSFYVSIIPDADFVTDTPLSAFLGHGNGRDTTALTVVPGARPLPVPARADVTIPRLQPAADTLTWGQTVEVRTTIENDGTAEAKSLRVRFVVTDANHPSLAPLVISDAVLASLPAGYKQDLIHTLPLRGALPAGVDPATIAPRISVVVDPENAIDEPNELDNQLASAPLKFRLLTKEATATPAPPQPGPVTTAPGTTDPATTPAPTRTVPPSNTNPAPRPTPAAGPQRRARARLRLDQAHQAAQNQRARRAAALAARRAINPRLKVGQPRLRVIADVQAGGATPRRGA